MATLVWPLCGPASTASGLMAGAAGAASSAFTTQRGTPAARAPLVATAATFDFDTGTPALSTGAGTPFDQTAGGVTAHFSSPTLGALGFSVQSDATTQFHLSQFSGNYLYPNSVYSPVLDIQFDRPLTSIRFTFATADFQQVETPTTIELTAYESSTATPPLGSATAHGTYAGDTMPMGTLTFNSATPFNLVEVAIPPAPLAASDFLVDNIAVETTQPVSTATPTNTPPGTATPSASPTPSGTTCAGDCRNNGRVTVDDIIVMVDIAMGATPPSACPAGDLNADGRVTVDEIVRAVNSALLGCGA